jgi:hypothetical protein
MRNAYKILVGITEGKRSLARPRRRWENDIKMDFKGCKLDSSGSGQGPKRTLVIKMVMNLGFHKRR